MSNVNTTILADMLREGMQAGKTPILTLTSNSMLPLLRTGDQVQLEAVNLDQYQVGDIITIVDESDPNQMLTHRFWGMAQTENGLLFCITRGDRPLMFDSPTNTANIVGRVRARFRNGRILRLNQGQGQRLNHHLANTAKWETNKLTGTMMTLVDNLIAQAKTSNDVARVQQSKISVKLLRRTLFALNFILVNFVSFFAQERTNAH